MQRSTTDTHSYSTHTNRLTKPNSYFQTGKRDPSADSHTHFSRRSGSFRYPGKLAYSITQPALYTHDPQLHKPSTTFDSLTFLEGFIGILQEEEMQVVTYRDLAENPDLTATDQDRLFIITIDDIYLRYPIAEGVVQMIDLLKEAGYPAVLGVITESDYVYPETAATLKELSLLGWEIASHTDSHRNLQEVMNISPKAIYPEVKTSLDKIENAIGLRPITLVLPFGQMTATDEQIKRTGVQWVVGINGGVTYEMDAAYYYVGRESPDTDPQKTFENMKMRFGE